MSWTWPVWLHEILVGAWFFIFKRIEYLATPAPQKLKIGTTLLELMIVLAFMSALALAAVAPIWKSFQTDKNFRDVLAFSDASSFIRATVEGPSCGINTFYVSSPAGVESRLMIGPSTEDISLSSINVVSPTGTVTPVATVSDSGDLRSMTLVPIVFTTGGPVDIAQGAQTDFKLKKYYFTLKIKGRDVILDGRSKTLTQDYFLSLNVMPDDGQIVSCFQTLNSSSIATSFSSKVTLVSAVYSESHGKCDDGADNTGRILARSEAWCLTNDSDGFTGFLKTTLNVPPTSGNLKQKVTCLAPPRPSENTQGGGMTGCLQVGVSGP